MYRPLLISILLLLCTPVLKGQQSINKDSLLLSEVHFERPYVESIAQIKTNLFFLINKDLDSNDIEIISNPAILGIRILGIALQKNSNPGKLTYQHIIEDLLEFKKDEKFSKLKTKFLAKKKLDQRPWLLENWQQDSLYMSLNLKYPIVAIENMQSFLEKTTGQYANYKEARTAYRRIKLEEKRALRYKNKEAFQDLTNVGYLKYLARAKEQHKPILLYFTGHACINCRKMENNIFSDEAIYQKLVSRFILVSLYVDDKTSVLGNSFKIYTSDNKQITTVGEYNIDVQKSEFNSNSQPTFIAIDYQKNILGRTVYTNSKDEFMNFLQEVLDK